MTHLFGFGQKVFLSERSKMSWLSPVQWAKWTWTAVRGGGEDDDGETDSVMDHQPFREEAQEALAGDQEDERSDGCRQV